MMIRRMTITAARGESRGHPRRAGRGGDRAFDMISSLPGVIFVGQKLNKGVRVATRQQHKLRFIFMMRALASTSPSRERNEERQDTPKTNDGVIDSNAFLYRV
jgi:hypothetical protein